MTKLPEDIQKIICGSCNNMFYSSNEYNEHICKSTGFKANSIEHLDALSGGNFSLQSKAAIERGSHHHRK